MEKASRFHIATGAIFLIATRGGHLIDRIDPKGPNFTRGAGCFISSRLAVNNLAAEFPLKDRRRGFAVQIDRLLLGLLAVTGGIMVLRGHLGLEIRYLVSACYAVVAVIYKACILAKAYHVFTRRIDS